jgi:glycosyltransferase involved in cell wall biosynthesis
LEGKIVQNASAISTVSEFVKFKIEKIVEVRNKPFVIIPNGFDDEAIEKIKDIKQTRSELTISLVGSLYDWHPYEYFLETIAKFLEAKKYKIKIKFYGTNRAKELNNLICNKFPILKDYVEIIGKMPNDQLLVELAKDNVMLLFNYYSYMGTKIFDYLGIKRKILLCFTDDKVSNQLKEKYYKVKENENYSSNLQADLLAETSAGLSVKNSTHLLQILEELCIEFQATSEIKCCAKNTENYSRRNYVQLLANFLKENL